MQKKLYIIHGWSGSPDEPMLAWIAAEAKKKGFDVFVPAMPHPDEPTIDDWVDHVGEVVKKSDQNTYFIGHSIGCQTILRYLEKINVKVGGVVLIAPWLILSDLETEEEKIIAKPWIETPINFEKVKKCSKKFVAIFSDDDPVVPYEENKKLFENKLDPKIVVEHNKGHFTEDDRVESLQAAIDAIMDICQDQKQKILRRM